MTDDETIPIFERGDVVYGDDPFNGTEAARPWLILSNLRSFRNQMYRLLRDQYLDF